MRIATFKFKGPYDSISAPARYYRVPCHDKDEAIVIFRQLFPNAENVEMISYY
jgi:hypothetical protein